jgi:hypothetical protein
LFLSCSKEANVKLPETKSLPVMYSYVCPTDSVIRLKLFYSSPLYGANQVDILAPVSDGDVKISGAQGTAQLIYNSITQYYELKTTLYSIIPGQVYKMTVITINGDVATAETQVPLTAVPINTVTVETYTANNSTYDRIKVSFTDEPGRLNYYRIAALHAFAYTFQPDTIADDTRICKLYSDINHDGENVSLDGRFALRNDSTEYYSTEYYDVFLYNCSESYYNFHKSLINYTGDNPFAEPSLIYSNVKGGFGCFGAYTRSMLMYKKK